MLLCIARVSSISCTAPKHGFCRCQSSAKVDLVALWSGWEVLICQYPSMIRSLIAILLDMLLWHVICSEYRPPVCDCSKWISHPSEDATVVSSSRPPVMINSQVGLLCFALIIICALRKFVRFAIFLTVHKLLTVSREWIVWPSIL